jgi:hypothetical protein
LTADQVTQVTTGATLVLPTLGAWSKVLSASALTSPPGYTFVDLDVNLEVFPDSLLGAGTQYRTYHFGIYGPPVPLIGEPTVLLPRDIAVDLSISSPPLTSAGSGGTYYDVLFAPSGQLLVTPTNPALSPNTAVFLWVRDTSKLADMTPTTVTPAWTFNPALRQFQKGGEQQIVGIRNGFVGSAPVMWPDLNSGTYGAAPNNDPYAAARLRLN